MKKNSGLNGYDLFGYIVLVVIILILFGCVIGIFCSRNKRVRYENFQTCEPENNLDDPNFRNQRFFKYDNVGHLLPNDPVHVNREVVQNALMNHNEYNNAFGEMENSCLKKKPL